MLSPLWKRELRGGQRRWWRQPWAVPAVILIGVVTWSHQALFGYRAIEYRPRWNATSPYLFGGPSISGSATFPSISVNPNAPAAIGPPFSWRLKRFLNHLLPMGYPTARTFTVTWLPQMILMIWIVGAIVSSCARDRRLGVAEQLAVSPMGLRGLALARALGTAGPTILGLTALAAFEVWVLNKIGKEDLKEIALLPNRLGHLNTAYDLVYDPPRNHGADMQFGPALSLWLTLELPLRAMMVGLSLATVTTWLAIRVRSAARTLLVVGLTFIFCTVLIQLVENGMHQITFTPTSEILIPPEFPTFDEMLEIREQRLAFAHRELCLDSALRFGLPLLWLAYWWRWAGRGFGKRWLSD